MAATAGAGGAVAGQVGFSGQLHAPRDMPLGLTLGKREFPRSQGETARLCRVGRGVEGRGAP